MTIIYHLGTPGSPGTPDTVLTVDATGWASGAISIPSVSGNGGYEFKVPASVVGAICGLANDYRGVGYSSIAHALYFSRGSVSLLEHGTTIQTLGAYVSSDKWVVYRTGSNFLVYKNGSLIVIRPALFTSDFILAGALYAVGDTIVDAKVVKVAVGSAVAEIGPLRAVGMSGYHNFGAVELSLSASAGAGNHGWGTVTIGVSAKASDHPYADASAEIGPISVLAEQNTLAPSWAIGDAALPGLSVSAFGYTGTVGSANVALKGVQALGSNKPYAAGSADVFTLDAFGAEAIDLSVGLLEYRGPYGLRMFGHHAETSGIMAEAERPVLNARGGGRFEIVLTRPALDASGTVPVVGWAELVGPAAALVAQGTTGGVGQIVLTYRSGVALVAAGGGIADLYANPGYGIEFSGLSGTTGTADLIYQGRLLLSASGQPENVGVCILVGPRLTPTPIGDAVLVGPAGVLYAVGGEAVEIEYEAYSINVKTGAVTHYTSFPFDNILRFGSRFFGVRADGIYELIGDTDDGDPIQARITTFYTDFSSANLKRVPWVYLVGRLGGSLDVTVEPAGSTAYAYPTAGAYTGQALTHRARVGRGLKGTRYSFSLTNPEGVRFEVDRMEAIIEVLTRAM